MDLLLRAARGQKGEVHVALVWPGRLESVASLHALSTLELTLDTQLEGLRTLFFPARFDSHRDFSGWLVDRPQLARLSRSVFKLCPERNVFVPEAKTFSKAKLSLLQAINDIESHAATEHLVPHPMIGEIVPTFLWQAGASSWTSYKDRLLERSLKKVKPLSLKQALRESIEGGLSVAQTATDALLAAHHDTKRADWRSLFTHLTASKRPDVLLLDASSAAARTNFQAVRRIPEFLSLARAKGLTNRDAVIVTDEPLAYFSLLARLKELHINVKSRLIVPAEPTVPFLSAQALPADWRPQVRSNARVTLKVVDRDASGVASAFYRIAHEINRDSLAAKALTEAGNYLIRLSNTPAGLRDIVTYCSDVELSEYARERLRWSHFDAQIRTSLQTGGYGPVAHDVQTALDRAEKLLDLWHEHTPMALCLRDEVKLLAEKKLRSLRVIVPSDRYAALGEIFLSRALGEDYETVRSQLTWTAQRQAGEMPRTTDRDHILFLGLTPEVARYLASDIGTPHGATVLASYRSAETSLSMFSTLSNLEPLKPFRGRLKLLVEEFDKRLSSLASKLNLERLGDIRTTFTFDSGPPPSEVVGEAAEANLWRFTLEGRGTAYATGLVYRYDEDEDIPFVRTQAERIQVDDLLFEMSDDLKEEVEGVLRKNNATVAKSVSDERMLLSLYHMHIKASAAVVASASSPLRQRAEAVHKKMLTVDPRVKECSVERVMYWLDVGRDDGKPHGASEFGFFKVFCEALGIPEAQATNYWAYVKRSRTFNQSLGRALAAQYAEILFQPQAAQVYRQIPAADIGRLRAMAEGCVFRVISIRRPTVSSKR